MPELKYLIFFATLIFGVPIGYFLALRYSWVEKLVFFLFIFFTCEMIDINFYSLEDYRGSSRGFEFGMVDITMYIVLALVCKRSHQYPVKWLPPGAILYLLYFIFSCLSLVHADVLVYSGFEITKMLRMFLYFWIAFNYLQREEQFETLLQSIGLITLYIFFLVLRQKYVNGLFQSMGPFPHQNSLTMYMSLLGALSLSRLLNRKAIYVSYWFILFAMASFCVLSTLSRAGLALYVLNCSIVFFISLCLRDKQQKEMRKRKCVILLIMPLVAAAGLYKASDSIIERFTSAPKESKISRILLAQAAVNMANENIWGIGLNNFGHKINDPYPYGAHIPVEISRDGSKRGLVETAYLMIAAETGWLNLTLFLTMLFYFYGKNLINIVRLKNSSLRYIPVALAGCLTQVYLQTTLEWVLKQTNNFYQLMLIFALIGAISKLLNKGERQAIDKHVEQPKSRQGAPCVTSI